MRILMIIVCLACLGISCSSPGSKKSAGEAGDAETSVEKSFPEENLKLVRLDVGGMTCEGCEKAIVSSICKLDGIEEASASHTAGEATIRYDSTKTGIEDISQAIADAGYSVVEGEKKLDLPQ